MCSRHAHDGGEVVLRALPILDSPIALSALDVAASSRQPTMLDAAWFHVRALRHRAARLLANRRAGVARAPRGIEERFPFVAASSSSPLWTSDDPLERPLVAGKVHNLRVAARSLDGAWIRAGKVLSFWAEVGPPWAMFGFVDGRELREGCLVPSPGGGLCQLSNALYGCALDAGFEIVERHAHTARLVGSAAAGARDATVFWSYVDLRFRSPLDTLVRVRLVDDQLRVELRTEAPHASVLRRAPAATKRPTLVAAEHGCDTCAQDRCGTGERARARVARAAGARTAFVVDEHIPELEAHIAAVRAPGDVLALPLPGHLCGLPQYAWDARGFDVVAAPFATLRRSRRLRPLRAEGAVRVAAQIEGADALARVYARQLGPDVDRVVVTQALLPHLWRAHALGGRRFEVFLHRVPLAVLHDRLDEAARAHPDSTLLTAYRAPKLLVEAEQQALAAASGFVTAHDDIARLFPSARRVPWCAPDGTGSGGDIVHGRGRRIVFPGPVAGRKGAHAVREVARRLGLIVVLAGAELEPPSFWDGIEVQRTTLRLAFRRPVRAVIQPALVEERPHRLLAALAARVPVVATPACGLPPHPLLQTVAFGDVDALYLALDEGLPRDVLQRD